MSADAFFVGDAPDPPDTVPGIYVWSWSAPMGPKRGLRLLRGGLAEEPVRASLADSGQGLTVDVLRELFRNYLLWKSAYESDGVDILPLPDGSSVSIHDMDYLLALSRSLPVRQRQAIYLCLILNHSEAEAARLLHLDGSSPIASHATAGVQAILSMCANRLAPSRAKVFAREATLAARKQRALTEPVIDFGPDSMPVDYFQFD